MTSEMWEEARSKRLLGESFAAIARGLGVSRCLISHAANKEGWLTPSDNHGAISLATQEKVNEKLSGIVSSGSAKKRAEQVLAVADKTSEIVLSHQRELAEARRMAIQARDRHRGAGDGLPDDEERAEADTLKMIAMRKSLAFEDLKAAKIHVETMKLIQEAERKAWNLDAVDTRDLSKLSDEELRKLARG